MSLARNLLQGSGILLLANISAKLLSLLTLPVLTMYLPPQVYGEAALISTLISLLSAIALAGMDMAYSRAYFGSESVTTAQVEQLIWRRGTMHALTAGVLGALIWLFYAMKHFGLHPQFAILAGVGVTSSLLMSLAQTRARLQAHYKRLATSVFISAVASYGVMLFMAPAEQVSDYALVSGYVAVYLVTLLILGIPSLAEVSQRQSRLEGPEAKAILMVGLPGIITAPAYWVVASSDRWFLNTYTDTATVGIYAIAVSVGTVGMLLNNAVLSAWVPEIVREYESNKEHAHHAIGSVQALIIVGYALVWLWVYVLSPDIIDLLVDRRFHGAVQYIPWLAAGVFFYGCIHLFNTSMLLKRKLHITVWVWILALMLSLIGNFLFVPMYGANAAAIAQSAAFAMTAILMAYLAYRSYKTDWLTGSLLSKMIVICVVAPLILWIPSSLPIISIILKSIFLLVFSMAMLAWCLPDKCTIFLNFVKMRFSTNRSGMQ
jgi:O-antigen/teichoic acid export membrane protein